MTEIDLICYAADLLKNCKDTDQLGLLTFSEIRNRLTSQTMSRDEYLDRVALSTVDWRKSGVDDGAA